VTAAIPERKDADGDSQTLTVEQLYQTVSSRQRTVRRQFVSSGVPLLRLKSRYTSRRRLSASGHGSPYRPAMSSRSPSASRDVVTPSPLIPSTPRLDEGSDCGFVSSYVDQIAPVVIIEIEDGDVENIDREVDAKVS